MRNIKNITDINNVTSLFPKDGNIVSNDFDFIYFSDISTIGGDTYSKLKEVLSSSSKPMSCTGFNKNR